MVEEIVRQELIDLSPAVASLATIVLGHESFELVIERLTEVTKQTIPGAYEVSVTMRDRNPVTVAPTGGFAAAVDQAQYDAGDGPCLHALRTGQTVVVTDQRTESRWPRYTARATEIGVRSSVSVPLQIADEHTAALNIYGKQPAAFSPDAIQAAESLAVYAAVIVSNADLYYSATTRAEQLAEAMASRAVIEQAKGVLMAGRRCTADDAFAILVSMSQRTHRKLRDVAQTIIDGISQPT